MRRHYFDTSVFVAAMVAVHPKHERCARLFEQAIKKGHQLFTASHTLAELYATLSRLPVLPRILLAQARQLVEENVLRHTTIIELTAQDYAQVIARMAELDLVSGAIYDGLQVRAAEKARADFLYTLNDADFLRMPPAAPTMLKLQW